jgi:23S rRNA pseudouridine1911/1915/1917 synthase
MAQGPPVKPPLELAILFEDATLLAVDKPAGVLSFPSSHGNEKNLADAARAHCARRKEKSFPVHRIDRDTSGVLIFAKTETAKNALEQAFREGAIEKTYLAIVNGAPRGLLGTVKTYIADLGDKARSSRTPIPGGKTALTDWRVRERFVRGALLEAKPRTGRFNQIRLHCVDLGCPIAGERKYSSANRQPLRAKRVMLHAARLIVVHPTTNVRLEIDSPVPADFTALLDELRGDASPRARRER